jgi:hypothetical protein
MLLSTRTDATEIHKLKINGKLCCKAQEHRQLRILSKQTRANVVPKHKNKNANKFHKYKIMGKLCCEAQEQ